MVALVVFVTLAGLSVMIAETTIHLPQPREGDRRHAVEPMRAGSTARKRQRQTNGEPALDGTLVRRAAIEGAVVAHVAASETIGR